MKALSVLAGVAGIAAGAVGATVAVKKLQQSQQTSESSNAIEPNDTIASLSSFYALYGKRACDLAISLAAMPFVAAVCGVCGAAVHLEDGGPVFYNAPRVGKDGREFTMYKLRSMKVDAPDLVMEDGSTYNGADDPRMTKVGAFLRKTSLDEMPQFINVLLGDMSVVGPRPDLKREVDLYRGEESLKLAVRPGITGYAAVYGRNSLPWRERLALDVYYVKHLSFPLDLEVFLKTFTTVFNQEGIYVKDNQEEASAAPESATEAVAQAATDVAAQATSGASAEA